MQIVRCKRWKETSMKIILYLLGLVVLFILFKKVTGQTKKYTAARNALLAKYTFENLDEKGKLKVIDRVKEILERGGAKADMINRISAKERFGFYVLAMDELGINPPLKGERWHIRRKPNPYYDLSNADKEVSAAQRHYINKNVLRIELED